MTGKRWYQVRWNADRTDNISVPDLEGAYRYVWTATGKPGIVVDSDQVTIVDMVTGRQYHVPVWALEYEFDAGWAVLSSAWGDLDALATLMQTKPSA